MSLPKLNSRKILKHPATLASPDKIEIGQEVVRCHIIQPFERSERIAQALFSLIDRAPGKTRLESMRDGYHHTNPWGIAIDEVGTIKGFRRSAYADFVGIQVTQSSGDLELHDRQHCIASDVKSIPEVIVNIPKAEAEYESIHEYETLGFAPNSHGITYVLFDRSKLVE